MDIKKLPISETCKQFFIKENINIPILYQATLCHRYGKKYQDVIDGLKNIANTLEDQYFDEMQNEINSRLKFELRKYELFKANPNNKAVYGVSFHNYKTSTCNDLVNKFIFETLDKAVEFGKLYKNLPFSIVKYMKIDHAYEVVTDICTALTGDGVLGRFEYDENGELLYHGNYTFEVKEDFDPFDPVRFENKFIVVDNPFDFGDIVMHPDTPDELMVLNVGREYFRLLSKDDIYTMSRLVKSHKSVWMDNTFPVKYVTKEGIVESKIQDRIFELEKVTTESGLVDGKIWKKINVISKLIKAHIDIEELNLIYGN